MTAFRQIQPALQDPADDIPEFCDTCALLQGYADTDRVVAELANATSIVESRGPYRAGECLFQRGEAFDALYAIRSGAVKLRAPATDGREQVAGFYLPGEVIGLRAVYPERFAYDAVALDTTWVCRYPFEAVCALANRRPAVQQHLFRLLGHELHTSQCLAAEHSADARVAAFLVQLGERYGRCGQSDTSLRLHMSRADIGNYLRLATETVSRVLARFRSRRWIRLQAHSVELLAPDRLRATGHALLTY